MDKCKSRAERCILCGLIIIIFSIIYIVADINNAGIHNLQHPQIAAYICFATQACLGVWFVLNNYRFRQKADSLGTPDQLLYGYDKKLKNDRRFGYFCWLMCVCCCFYNFIFYNRHGLPLFNRDDITPMVISVIFLIVCIVLFIYNYKGGYNNITRRDVEIIEQLKDLTEK